MEAKLDEKINEGIKKFIPELLIQKKKSLNLHFYEEQRSLLKQRKDIWEKWKITISIVKPENMEHFVSELEDTLRSRIFSVNEKLNYENKFALQDFSSKSSNLFEIVINEEH